MSMAEQYNALAPWLCAPVDRANRAYFETHLALLSDAAYQFLEIFTSDRGKDPREQRRLSTRLQLLRYAREHGSTPEGARAAYTNQFGGLLLDIPAWLVEVEQSLMALSRWAATGRTVTASKLLLRDAIRAAQHDHTIAPEIIAELQYRLGSLFVADFRERSVYALETAIGCFEAALQVYTAECYPLQYAKTLTALGDAYGHFPIEQQADNLAKALRCYEAALQACR